MRALTKSICLLLAIALALPMTAMAAQKEQETAEPYSLYFVCYGTGLTKITDRVFEICFDVTARDTMTQLGTKEIKLQRSSNGTSGWTTVKTFTPDNYAQMLCENTASHMDSVNYTGTSGYYYRTYTTYYAKNSNGSATANTYSNVLKI